MNPVAHDVRSASAQTSPLIARQTSIACARTIDSVAATLAARRVTPNGERSGFRRTIRAVKHGRREIYKKFARTIAFTERSQVVVYEGSRARVDVRIRKLTTTTTANPLTFFGYALRVTEHDIDSLTNANEVRKLWEKSDMAKHRTVKLRWKCAAGCGCIHNRYDEVRTARSDHRAIAVRLPVVCLYCKAETYIDSRAVRTR